MSEVLKYPTKSLKKGSLYIFKKNQEDIPAPFYMDVVEKDGNNNFVSFISESFKTIKRIKHGDLLMYLNEVDASIFVRSNSPKMFHGYIFLHDMQHILFIDSYKFYTINHLFKKVD